MTGSQRDERRSRFGRALRNERTRCSIGRFAENGSGGTGDALRQ